MGCLFLELAAPYFRPNTIYFGDCRDVLRKFPDGCVDLVYADPPFSKAVPLHKESRLTLQVNWNYFGVFAQRARAEALKGVNPSEFSLLLPQFGCQVLQDSQSSWSP
jgi:16S rRNA G966 N2-methylase RsmD